MLPSHRIARARGGGGLLDRGADLGGDATAGPPPSALGGRTAKPDLLSRDTASPSGPTAIRTTRTFFNRPRCRDQSRSRVATVVIVHISNGYQMAGHIHRQSSNAKATSNANGIRNNQLMRVANRIAPISAIAGLTYRS